MTIQRFVLTHGRQLGTAAGLLLLCLVLTIASPHFLTVSNLLNVAQQTSINAIIAAGNVLARREDPALRARIGELAQDESEPELVRRTAAETMTKLARD